MGETIKITIPVEVTDESGDLSSLKETEELLDRLQDAANAKIDGDMFGEIEKGAKKAADVLGDVKESMSNIGKGAEGLQQSGEEVDKFTQRVEKSQKSLLKAAAEKIRLVVQAIDEATPAINNIKNILGNLAGKVWKVTLKAVDLVTAPFRKIKDIVTSPITIGLSMAGVSLGAQSFINEYKEFTSIMSSVKSISGATGKDFDDLVTKARQLGATTKFTATQAGEGMQYLAMAGWKTNDIISAMPGLLSLAAAGATDLGTASDIVSDVMTAFGMSSDQATRAADIFAATASNSNTNISMMGESMKYAAPAARAFGIDLAETSTIVGMMANAGIKASSAGTALRSSLLRMASPTSSMQKTMKKLGMSFADSNGNMKDMGSIIREMSDAFSGLSEQQQLAAANDLFGKNAASAWLAVISQGTGEYDKLYQKINESNGAAQNMANTQLDNLEGDLAILQSAVSEVKLSIMDRLGEKIRSVVQWATEQVPKIGETVNTVIDNAISAFDRLQERFNTIFSSMDFQNADLAGKVRIMWDEIIAKPFEEWWNSNGKETILNLLSELGSAMGQIYHGIAAGIISAITGKEIDASFDLSGFAKAGAEAASSFVGSFMEGLDIGGLFNALPTGAKAGIGLYAGANLGSAAMGIVRNAALIKIAFSGIGAAAPVAAEGVAEATVAAGESASIFSVLGGLMASVPGWGWALAAAIGVAALAIYGYNKQIEQEQQELINLSRSCEEANANFTKGAEQVRSSVGKMQDLLSEKHKIEFILSVKKDFDLTPEQCEEIVDRINNLQDDVVNLAIDISQSGNISAEDAVETANTLADVENKQISVLASIISYGNTEKGNSVYELINKYNNASFDKNLQAQVAAEIIANCDNEEQAGTVLGLLKDYDNANLTPSQWFQTTAMILSTMGGNADASTLLGILKDYENAQLNGGEYDYKAALEAEFGTGSASAYWTYLPLFEYYEKLKSNEAKIVATLESSGVSSEDISKLQELANLINEKEKLTLLLEVQGLSEEECEEYKKRIQEIDEALGKLSGAEGASGAALDSAIAAEQQRLELVLETLAAEQALAAARLRNKMPEIISKEEESRQKEEAMRGEVAAKQAEYIPLQQRRIDATNLERERVEKLGTAGYEEWMRSAGGYIDKMSSLVADSRFDKETDEISWNDEYARNYEAMASNLDYGGTGAYEAATDNTIADTFESAAAYLESLIDGLEAELTAQEKQTAEYAQMRQNYLNAEYGGIVHDNFKGTAYDGMSIEDIISHFEEFSGNPELVEALTNTIAAVNDLNSDLVDTKGWFTEDELIDTDALLRAFQAAQEEHRRNRPSITGTQEEGSESVSPVDISEVRTALLLNNTMKGKYSYGEREIRGAQSALEGAKTAEDIQSAKEARDNAINSQIALVNDSARGIDQLTGQINAKGADIDAAKANGASQSEINALQQEQIELMKQRVTLTREAQNAMDGLATQTSEIQDSNINDSLKIDDATVNAIANASQNLATAESSAIGLNGQMQGIGSPIAEAHGFIQTMIRDLNELRNGGKPYVIKFEYKTPPKLPGFADGSTPEAQNLLREAAGAKEQLTLVAGNGAGAGGMTKGRRYTPVSDAEIENARQASEADEGTDDRSRIGKLAERAKQIMEDANIDKAFKIDESVAESTEQIKNNIVEAASAAGQISDGLAGIGEPLDDAHGYAIKLYEQLEQLTGKKWKLKFEYIQPNETVNPTDGEGNIEGAENYAGLMDWIQSLPENAIPSDIGGIIPSDFGGITSGMLGGGIDTDSLNEISEFIGNSVDTMSAGIEDGATFGGLFTIPEESTEALEYMPEMLENLGGALSLVEEGASLGEALFIDPTSAETINGLPESMQGGAAGITAIASNMATASSRIQKFIKDIQEAKKWLEVICNTNWIVYIDIVARTLSGSSNGFAEGGIVTSPIMSWVGEDGPEAIIPLGSKRRERGLDLWRRAGAAMGASAADYAAYDPTEGDTTQPSVNSMDNAALYGGMSGFANGLSNVRSLAEDYSDAGINAPFANVMENIPEDYWNNLFNNTGSSGEENNAANLLPFGGFGAPMNNAGGEEDGNGTGGVSVSVSAQPAFTINGSGDPEEIMDAISSRLGEMAEMIGGEIANQVEAMKDNLK